METKLCILVCGDFCREVETIIEEECYEHVVIVPFPSSWDAPASRETFLDTLQQITNQSKDIICLPERAISPTWSEPFDINRRCLEHCRLEMCCSLVLGHTLFEHYRSSGAFLFLPGMLEHWHDYIETLQQRQRQCQETLAPPINRLLLIDTGIGYEHASANLASLSETVGLPGDVLPTGLDYLRLFLKNLLVSWFLHTAQEKQSQIETDFQSIKKQFEQRVEDRTAQLAATIKSLEWEVQVRKGAETALRESRTWYQRLLASVTDYIYTVEIVDGHPSSTTHGTACVAVTGYTAEEYELDPLLWYRMIYPDDQAVVLDQVTRLLAGEVTQSIEHRIIHKDGSIRWVRNTPVLRYDDYGNLIAYDGLITDITERRQAEDALRESEERYRQLNADLERRVAERTAELEAANKDLQQQIAERKRFEEAMHKSEERLELAMLGSDDGFWDWDIVTGVDYFSPRWAEMLGYDVGEIEPHIHSWEQLIHSDDRPRVNQAFQAHVAGQTPLFEVRHRMKTRSGEWKWVLYRGKVVSRNEEGRAIRMAGTQRDITELKQAEEDLRQAKEAAEAANRAKSEFLANMSHEIRTPMNAVIGMTNLLLDTPLSADQREFAETIYTSSNTLLTLINDILDFSKIEGGKLSLEQQPFNIHLCIEEALDLVVAAAEQKRLGLTYRVAPGTPDNLLGDVTRVRQILVNLLSNAIKFTERGEVIVFVDAREPIEGSTNTPQPATAGNQDEQDEQDEQGEQGEREIEIHLAVRDTGIGIAQNDIARLFKSFSQLDTSMTRKYGGTGLGLVISRRLAEMMGGRIWVESEPGQGSTFHVTFRAGIAQGVQDTEEIDSKAHEVRQAHVNQDALTHYQAAEGDQSSAPSNDSLARKRILIVDDRSNSRHILVDYVQSWGMLPVGVSSLEEAADTIDQSDPFDVIVLDLHDTGGNMQSLVKEMRQIARKRLAASLSAPPETVTPPPVVCWTALTDVGSTIPDDPEAALLNRPIKPSRFYNVLVDILLGETATPEKRGTGGPGVQRKPIPLIPTELSTMAQRNPLRILVVEDNAINQKVALRLLERLGYRADIAANGLEALASLERQQYDVVLMDVQMPEMDGFVATHHIRTRWPAPRQPHIVAMTARTLQGDREKCLEAGMNNYISKPISLDQLVAALEQVQPPPSPLHHAEEETSHGSEAGPGDGAPPANPAEQPDLSVVDLNALRHLQAALGDDSADVVQEIVQLYISDTPRLLTNLRQALAARDLDTFTRAAHSLKSSSAQVGAMELSQLCKEMEARGRSGSLDGGKEQVARAETLYEPVKAALETLLLSEAI
jgi:PAS domain S-box-containing protein